MEWFTLCQPLLNYVCKPRGFFTNCTGSWLEENKKMWFIFKIQVIIREIVVCVKSYFTIYVTMTARCAGNFAIIKNQIPWYTNAIRFVYVIILIVSEKHVQGREREKGKAWSLNLEKHMELTASEQKRLWTLRHSVWTRPNALLLCDDPQNKLNFCSFLGIFLVWEKCPDN